MTQKPFFILNLMVIGPLILIFEHITEYSFFGFFYPWIGFIFTSFLICFSLSMPYFLRNPRGLHVLFIGITFILFQMISSTPENFRTSVIFISLIVITSIVVKNSDPRKLKIFLRIITYCCLANFVYAVFDLFYENRTLGTYRFGGLDQTPVNFGYNMLLGFWLVLINSIIDPGSNKSNTKLDKYFAFLFVIGILLSQTRGAYLGLTMGILAVLFFQRKIDIKILFGVFMFCTVVGITIILFPLVYWDVFGFYKVFGAFQSLGKDSRFILWSNMFEQYADSLNVTKFLFGGGQGYGTDLTGRGVHSDHFKLLFDHGIIGLLIYYYNVLSCLKLTKEFNIYILGFVVSTFFSGITYVNFGSITNSFSYILVIIVLSNYNKFLTVR